jgi:hypothetical protein
VLCFPCTSKCCLQCASVLQAGIVFQAINWHLFFISQTKRTALCSNCDKTHTDNNPQYKATAHFMPVRQLLTASGSVLFTAVLVLHHEKKGFAGNV